MQPLDEMIAKERRRGGGEQMRELLQGIRPAAADHGRHIATHASSATQFIRDADASAG